MVTPVEEETFVITKKYTVIGDPIPLARPRFSSRGGKTHVFDAQHHLRFGAQIQLRKQHASPIITQPIAIHVCFYFKQTTKKNTTHCKKPDIDNLIKWILDISTGILFKDDCQVFSLYAQKLYDSTPRTEMIISIGN